jgi:hypothetical protein
VPLLASGVLHGIVQEMEVALMAIYGQSHGQLGYQLYNSFTLVLRDGRHFKTVFVL